jgi:hypothetical protein
VFVDYGGRAHDTLFDHRRGARVFANDDFLRENGGRPNADGGCEDGAAQSG